MGEPAQWSPPTPPDRSFPHAQPTPYHLMLRTWSYAWWKPTVGVLLAGLGMLLVAPFALLPVLAAGVALQGGPFLREFERAATLQTVSPAALLYLNLVLGSMILVTWAIVRWVHRMRPRWLASVVPRLRWRFLLPCLGLALLALVAQVVVGALVSSLGGAGGDDVGGAPNPFTTTTAVTLVVVVLTTPLQAAGEEYLFRGYLLQAFGSLSGRRWVAIGLTAILFALAHGTQNFPLFFDRLAFGLIAGWLVTRTGGLEAGIALHVVNNFLAYGLALAYGDLTATLTVSEVGWSNIVLTLTQSAVYTVLVVWLARRRGLQTRTAPPLASAPAAGPESLATH
jgi:membrane protease YdiL (CAAX protease family)